MATLYDLRRHVVEAGARPAGHGWPLSFQKINAVKDEQPGRAFTPQEQLALQLTDSMTRDVRVPDALFERLRKHFDNRGLVDLVATVAAYNMVSRFLVALNIER